MHKVHVIVNKLKAKGTKVNAKKCCQISTLFKYTVTCIQFCEGESFNPISMLRLLRDLNMPENMALFKVIIVIITHKKDFHDLGGKSRVSFSQKICKRCVIEPTRDTMIFLSHPKDMAVVSVIAHRIFGTQRYVEVCECKVQRSFAHKR